MADEIREIIFKVEVVGDDKATKELNKTAEAGKEVKSSFGDASNATSDLAESIVGMNSELGGAVSNLKNAAKQSLDYVRSLTKVQSGVTKTAGAMKILRVALISTGIGALIVALGSLVTFFTKTQRGADMLAKGLAAVGAVIDTVIQRFANFGEGLLSLISGNFSQGIQQIRDAFDGIGADIKNAAVQGVALEKEFQRIREASRALNVEFEKQRANIEELKMQSDDTTRSIAGRMALAKEAFEIENDLLSRQIALENERLDLVRKKAQLDGEVTAGELDEIADQEIAIAQIRQQSLTLQTELQNKINSLQKEGNAIAEQRILDELAAQQELKEFREQSQSNQAEFETFINEANKRTFDDKSMRERQYNTLVISLIGQRRKADAEANQQAIQDFQLRQTKAVVAFQQISSLFSSISDARNQRLQNELKAVEGNAKAEERIKKKLAQQEKRQSIFQSIIATALGITQALPNIPLAIITGIQGAIQTATIAATPAFGRGGVLKGATHQTGGININAENDEAIINARSMRSRDHLTVSGTPKQIASAINSYKGYGVQFQRGGVPLASAASQRAQTAATMKAIERSSSRMNRLRVVNVATETQDVLNKITNIQNEAST